MKTKMYRQGDVLLVACKKPRKLIPLPPEGARLILAHGEVTGHHHSVDPSTASLATRNDELFLLVQEGGALLAHQEHAPIALPAGNYRVIRQREYVAKQIRRVTD